MVLLNRKGYYRRKGGHKMGKKIKVEGIIPAMQTPFREKGDVDGIRISVDLCDLSRIRKVYCDSLY